MLLRNLALASSLALAAAPAAVYADVPAAVETAQVKAPTASSADATSYADREQQEPTVADFQGGDLVVIGVSGGALIVLLFLLLILV